jgi:aminopeptidase N
MYKIIRPFILFVLFIFVSHSTAQMFGQEPFERKRTYDVEHIKIDVKLDLEKKTLEGKVTTLIRPLVERLSSFKVDAVDIDIKSVKEWYHLATDDPELAERFADIKYDYDNKEIIIYPSFPIAKNYPFKYQVEYSTTDPEKGMYFISPDSLFPDKPLQVWTQGEGEDNRYWLPCYDYPNDKAETETYITIDSKYITLSNGSLIETKDNSDGTKTWHWKLNHPHSSYLIMIAAGEFDIIEDSWNNIPVYSYVPVGKKDEALKSFNLTADMMKFFSEYIGYTYPWERYSQVVVKDFIYGGMENTSATVLYEGSIYDDRTPPDYTATGLVAHELAHQWWGDVITLRNWNEMWLNESFATYFEALYNEYAFGKDEFDYEIYRNGQNAIKTDTVSRKPIYMRKGLTVNTYDKGSVVLNMLRYLMGDDDFRKAMNIYITKNEFNCVVSDDLLWALSEVYNDPLLDRTPRDFVWLFDEWIYKAGQPEYSASYVYDEPNNKVLFTVRQIQKPDSITSIFKIQIPVQIVTEKSKLDYTVVCDTAPKTYTFSLDSKLKSVIFNKGNKVLCKLYFSKPKEDWLYQLNNSEDAVDRVTAIKGLKDFINDYDVINDLSVILKNDKFWGVRYEAASVFAFSGFQGASSILTDSYGNEPDSRVRRSILLALGKLKKNCADCIETEILKNFIIGSINKEQSYYAIADGISSLTYFVPKENLYDLIIPFSQIESSNEIVKRSILAALDSSNDSRGIDILIENAVKGRYPRQRVAAINALEDFVNEPKVVDALNGIIFTENRWVKLNALSALEKANNKSSVPYLENLLKETNDESIKNSVNKVLEKIR